MRRRAIAVVRLAFIFLLMASADTASLAQRDGEPVSIGTYRVMHSDILNEDRLLFVHLPREYEQTQQRYPVLYLLYAHLYEYFADAVSIAEKLGGTGEIPPLIIIGVANTNRYRDLLPVKSRRIAESGGAEEFVKCFEEELIPFVNRTYRTNQYRIVAGPQAAAVFSLYALMSKPTLFRATISENPFMNPENAAYLYARAEQFFKGRKTLHHWLYIRCENNERPQDLDYVSRFRKLLEAEKPQGFHLTVDITEPSGDFTPSLPFSQALRSLFAAHKLPSDFQTNSLNDILEYYKDRSEEYGFHVDPPDHMLTFEGAKLNQKGEPSKAIEIFEYQHRLYPKSLNALIQLGDTYRGIGQIERAKEYYEAFLKIEARDAAYIQRRLSEMGRMIDSSAAYRIELEIRKNGIQAGLKKAQEMRSDPSNRLYVDENEFNALGYRFMGAGNMEAALEVFKLNVQLHPRSANVYDSLGEVYLKMGQIDSARVNYTKSLELDPQNSNARETLKRLEEH